MPEACDNTLWIAERANVEIEFGKPQLPDFPLPEGFADDAAYLRAPHVRGRPASAGATSCPTRSSSASPTSCKVIADMGFSSYFLIVWDLIQHARTAASGSARAGAAPPGCAVAYCLRITDLDPIKYDLLFERFLNPSRISMPDIDMDFDSRYRDEMIRYAAERYGRDHVAQIVTFSTIKARAAVRDAARVLGYPYAVGDKIAKAMPPLVMGRDTPLYACLEPAPEVRRRLQDGRRAARRCTTTDPDAKQVIDVAKRPRGPAPPGRHPRRRGGDHQGAAHRVPARSSASPSRARTPSDAPVVTQYEMHGVEDLGLLKMDFLGLRNLDVITDTARAHRARPRGIDLDIDDVALDDDADASSCCAGATRSACSSSRAAPMRALMRSLAPTSFEDVAALVALYRPGPMAANMHNDYADRKNGRKPVEYLHPDAEEILGRHLRADDLPGVGDAGGAEVRRLLARRGRQPAQGLRQEDPRAHREGARRSSSTAARRTGYGARARQRSCSTSSSRSPTTRSTRATRYGYGFVAYQTAYLKANYPVEYLAALLTSVKTNLDKAAVYLNECRPMGIEVLVPDVNVSSRDFVASPVDGADGVGGSGAIPFGLSAVRNVGEGLVELHRRASATRTARSSTSTTSASGSTRRCSTSGRSSR